MKTSKFHDNDFYENYVLGRLSENEESWFEEHMLSCEYCKNQLELTENIINGIKKSNGTDTLDIPRKKTSQRLIPWFSIAASLLIIVSLGILLTKNKNKSIEISKQVPAFDSVKTHKEQTDSLLPDKDVVQTKEKNTELLAEAFKPNAIFENTLMNNLRSNSLEVISPKVSTKITTQDSLIFNWKSNSTNFSLVIFDNKAHIIFEEQVTPPFTFTKKLINGLYYWQLETEEEAVFTGKFIMKK